MPEESVPTEAVPTESVPADAAVRVLLGAAGIQPSDEEMAIFAAAYSEVQAGVDSLYAIPEARYASPALVFSATPTFAEWSE